MGLHLFSNNTVNISLRQRFGGSWWIRIYLKFFDSRDKKTERFCSLPVSRLESSNHVLL
jgi:hypothetical protein